MRPLAAFLLASALLPAAGPGLLAPKEQDALLHELSGEAAHDEVETLTRFERIQASDGWHQAALHIKDRLEKLGYSDAHIEGWPSNGSSWYYTWQTPIGWRASGAELWMIEPFKKKLADYNDLANSLVKHSASADVTAELVDVGSGLQPEEYQDRQILGKIVLAYGYSGKVAREAVLERGALGMVNYIPQWDRKDHPDLLPYTAIWPKWEERRSLGFGFNVSKNDAQDLLNLLRSGKKVVLKAKVNAQFYESQIEILTTTIRGTAYPDQEVLLLGHLDHPQPSANDNASGSAGLVEMARTLKTLIDRGEIPAPKRTIRFLWVSEYFGTVAYLKAHPDTGRRTIAAINCDMIGEDQAKVGSYFYATRTPDSRPSFLNDLVESFVHLADSLQITELRGSRGPFHYRILPYAGGSDHYFLNDSSIGVPATMFGHEPDPYHHTSQDTPDKVDPTELKRVCFIALGSAWFMANAGDRDAERLLYDMYRGSLGRFSSDLTAAEIAMDAGTGADELNASYQHARNVLQYSAAREAASIGTVGIFASSDSTRTVILDAVERFRKAAAIRGEEVDNLNARLQKERNLSPRVPEPSPEERSAAALVPRRDPDFKAPLGDSEQVEGDYLTQRLGHQAVDSEPIPEGNAAWEAVNFIDGSRTLLEIYQALDAEFPGVALSALNHYFALLERARLIMLARKDITQ